MRRVEGGMPEFTQGRSQKSQIKVAFEIVEGEMGSLALIGMNIYPYELVCMCV